MLKYINKQNKIIIASITAWGLILTTSGIVMQCMDNKPIETSKSAENMTVNVIQKRVQEVKNNEIKLNDMTSEVNEPLSLNVKDYLENPNDIEDRIIKQLKLDTSMININQAGAYTYTISYKKKKYNGTYIIKDKELPAIEVITLKSLNLKTGSKLPTEMKDYITEDIPNEIIDKISINLSNVDTNKPGNYQYTVTYNKKLYTGTITIFEPQEVKNNTKVETEKQNKEKIEEEKNEQTQKETTEQENEQTTETTTYQSTTEVQQNTEQQTQTN